MGACVGRAVGGGRMCRDVLGAHQAGGTDHNIYSLHLTAQLAAPQMAPYQPPSAWGGRDREAQGKKRWMWIKSSEEEEQEIFTLDRVCGCFVSPLILQGRVLGVGDCSSSYPSSRKPDGCSYHRGNHCQAFLVF